MANKLLVNYILLMQNALGVRKIAFWGHGKNFQARRGDWFSEWIKRKLSTKVHWWFAYNDLSARIVTGLGFPEKRMTIVQNAIDSRQLINALKELRTVDLDKVRKEIGIKGKHVGLYVGGIYPEKQIPFLLGALDIVREKIPDFEMIFIGAGVDAPLIIERSKDRPWIHYLGPRFNLEKVPYFAVSQLFLMPGLVGLAIIDCLSLDLPLVTTRSDLHSPEIDYLRSGVNGLMVDAHGDERIYAQAVVDLLNNEKERFKMIEGCKATREKYTIEAMAENFSNGIISALKN
jgi:glycosyltransferase involved in cell wall biosynthesis